MKINLDQGYFSRIIQGKVIPPERILLLIENVFQVNPRWLEDGIGEMYSEPKISPARKQVLESIEYLDDEQIKAASSFTCYLTECRDEK